MKNISYQFLFLLLVSCGGGSERREEPLNQNSIIPSEIEYAIDAEAEDTQDLIARDKLNYQVTYSQDLMSYPDS